MGNIRLFSGRGPHIAWWRLGLLLPVCLAVFAAPCGAFTRDQKKPKVRKPASGVRRPDATPASGVRRNPTSGSGRLLQSQGSGRRMSPAGGGRLAGPIGSGMPVRGGGGIRMPAAGWGVPVQPPQGGGAPVGGIRVWPGQTQPGRPGTDPEDPTPRPTPREWIVPPDIMDGTSGPIREDPIGPHPMADLADQMARTARTQLRQGNTIQAESSLSSAVTLFPSDPVMRIEYALALSSVGNFHGAVRQLVDGFRLHPDLVVEPLNVVEAYGGEEKFAERMEQIDQYRAEYPQDSNSRFLHGFLKLHSGSLTEARDDFLALKESDPDFPFLGSFCRRLDGLELAESMAAEVEEKGANPPVKPQASQTKEPER